jgi:hypothetical protein
LWLASWFCGCMVSGRFLEDDYFTPNLKYAGNY